MITRRRLSEFAAAHPEAAGPLDRWYRVAKRAEWSNLAEVREDFPHADPVAGQTVFNVGGNKFRLITRINYRTGKVFIRQILTHREYDKGSWKA